MQTKQQCVRVRVHSGTVRSLCKLLVRVVRVRVRMHEYEESAPTWSELGGEVLQVIEQIL